jgi:acyl-coenzyme A synthetase/AMP-(fatty) acid ligase
VAGNMVSPFEIERLVMGSQLVSDVAVLSRTHGYFGEAPIAVVILREMEASPLGVLRDMRSWATKELPGFKRPVDWYAVEELPRTHSGKIDRVYLSKALVYSKAPHNGVAAQLLECHL